MKRITALLLALLFLASHAGFSLNIHFCGDRVVNSKIAIGDPNLDCGMAKEKGSCENRKPAKGSISSNSCCKNIHAVYQLNDNSRLQECSCSFHKDIFNVVAIFYISEVVTNTKLVKIFFHPYPPPLSKSLFILFLSLLN